MENTQVETEENEDEIEYIVERLDEIDDVELNDTQAKQQEEEGEVEYAEAEEDEHLRIPSDEEDTKPTLKKIKIESVVSID